MADGRRAGIVRSSLRARLAALRCLARADRRILIEAGCAVPAMRLAVWVFGFRRVYRFLGRRALNGAQRVHAPSSETARTLQIARLVDMASRHTPLSNTCLHRSLVLWWMLRRRGCGCDLRFGARRRGGRLEAHAWVEQAGRILNDDPAIEHRYTSLPWIPVEDEA